MEFKTKIIGNHLSEISDDICYPKARNMLKGLLISDDEIQKQIKSLGAKITADYADKRLKVITVLSGAQMFMADLAREIKLESVMDEMIVKSYSKTKSGEIKIIKDIRYPVNGEHVLIVEDIIDTGKTLDYITKHLYGLGAKNIEIACLLDKPSRREIDVKVKYCCFEIPDMFVVGYGLDYEGIMRNLPFIGVVDESKL